MSLPTNQSKNKLEISRRGFVLASSGWMVAEFSAFGTMQFPKFLLAESTSANPVVSSTADFENDLPSDSGALARRASLLASQIRGGCGYYGFPLNYVPLLKIEYFKDQLETVLKTAVDVETALSPIIAAAQAAAITDTQLQSSISQANALVSSLQAQFTAAVANVNALLPIIDSMRDQAASQKQTMLASQARFNSAVQAASNGCSLGQVLQIAATVVAVVASVYTAGASLVAVGGAIATTGLDLYQQVTVDQEDGSTVSTNQLNPTYKTLVTATKDLGDVATKFGSLQKQLQSDADSGRIVMMQTDSDTLASDFDSKVDGANIDQSIKDDFKLQTHRYFDLVQARNKKILERDGWILKIHDFDAQIHEQQTAIATFSDARATNANPDQAELARVLLQMQAALRDNLRLLVWYEIRALALWTQKPLGVSGSAGEYTQILGASSASLLLAHDQLAAQFLTAQLNQPGGPQEIAPLIQVKVNLSSVEAAHFAKSHSFAFSIDESQFPGMAEVMVTSVKVQVSGVSNFSGQLVHTGRQSFVSKDGLSIEYSTLPWVGGIQKAVQPLAISIGGTAGEYVGVSPLSDWILRADKQVSGKVLAQAREIELVFGGSYTPAKSA